MKKKRGGEKLRHTYQQKVVLDKSTTLSVEFLSQVMICLWNLAVLQAEKWLLSKEKAITAYSFNYWLTGMRNNSIQINCQEICLAEISSDLSREVLRKLAGSYQSFFELKKKKDWAAKKPSAKKLDQFQTLSWSTFKVTNEKNQGKIILPKGAGESLEIAVPKYLWDKVVGREIVHITLSKKDGYFFLSLVVVEPLPKLRENPTFFRAIDLGAGDIAVSDSDGSEFLIPARRPDKYWARERKIVEIRQAKCEKRSRTWKKRAVAWKKKHELSRNQHISYQRKLADALVEEKVECIVLSKPRTRLGLAKIGEAKQHVGVQNTGYMFRLLIFIKEKAAERGVPVVEIADPRRDGALDDPNTKLFASRKLLAESMAKVGLSYPAEFRREGFSFQQ